MLKVEHLCKSFSSFKLKDVSFFLPKGYIMGFIGMNGAGKSTTLKSILNLVRPDSGEVTVFGKNMQGNEAELKQKIGFMLGANEYYSKTTVNKLIEVYKRFYREWSDERFNKLLLKFSIERNKKISELSSGMKTKLGIAMTLSHNARLFIFDEPTSGLDPIARDEIMDIFRGIIEDGEKSILFSTHITSDLDKCADYIIIIKNGMLVANDTKDNLIDKHTLVKGKVSDLTDELKSRLISFKTSPYGFSGLALKEKMRKNDSLQFETPNLEDLTVYYNKETAL